MIETPSQDTFAENIQNSETEQLNELVSSVVDNLSTSSISSSSTLTKSESSETSLSSIKSSDDNHGSNTEKKKIHHKSDDLIHKSVKVCIDEWITNIISLLYLSCILVCTCS